MKKISSNSLWYKIKVSIAILFLAPYFFYYLILVPTGTVFLILDKTWPANYANCLVGKIDDIVIYVPRAKNIITFSYKKKLIIENNGRDPVYVDVETNRVERRIIGFSEIVETKLVPQTETVLVMPGQQKTKEIPHIVQLCKVSTVGKEIQLKTPYFIWE